MILLERHWQHRLLRNNLDLGNVKSLERYWKALGKRAFLRSTPTSIKAELVKLRYFAGLRHREAAEALGLSRATADRNWAYAKAYLYAALQDNGE